ncbi:MAG: biotin transporter BioY [Spirochaetota bacterium]
MITVTTPIARAFAVPHTRSADLLLAVLGGLAIGVLAQISVPMWPVPVTGQTLGVLAVAAALGPRRGTFAVLAYLAQGAAGMPVFAGGTAGPAVLVGPTGGYLVGFVPAALLVGAWFEHRSTARRTPATPAGVHVPAYARAYATADALLTAGVLAAATLVVYASGTVWLSRFVGWDRVVALGIAPFLVGDALKIALVALAASAALAVGAPREGPFHQPGGSSAICGASSGTGGASSRTVTVSAPSDALSS